MSANDARRKIRVIAGGQTRPQRQIDFNRIARELVKAQAAPTYAGRAEAAVALVPDMVMVMNVLRVLTAEVQTLKPQVSMFAQQNADLGTIVSVLLTALGGEHRVRSDWFAAYERQPFGVTEEEGQVIFRFLDEDELDAVSSESADEQTEES